MVQAHQRLRTEPGREGGTLHQFQRPQGDSRRHSHSQGVPLHLRGILHLRRERRSRMARNSGGFHQQDAVPVQNQQGYFQRPGQQAPERLHGRGEEKGPFHQHDILRRRRDRRALYEDSLHVRRQLGGRLQSGQRQEARDCPPPQEAGPRAFHRPCPIHPGQHGLQAGLRHYRQNQG